MPPTLIDTLRQPARYAHPVTEVEVIETHANWVLLAGDYAYKIKKPVDFGFLDFSSLEKRRHFCEEELRLNRRQAPELYLRVVPISGSPDDPVLDGDRAAFEYAVQMTRFDHAQRLDRRLQRGEVSVEDMDRLAEDIAAFHDSIPVATADSGRGNPESVWSDADDNFKSCRERLSGEAAERLREVETLSRRAYEAIRPLLEQRRDGGHVRECHGDLHLGNLVHYDGRVHAFDCIEFNPALRWIDTANEIAFLLMDLHARGEDALAARWRNHYLECSGDYGAAALLPFFQAYRAMVRAKVALLAAEQKDGDDAAADRARAIEYLDIAADFLQPRGGGVVLMHGLSGSGKSVLARQLVETLPALCLRSDVERKRLFGLPPLAHSGSAVGGGLYDRRAGERTYDRLAELAQSLAAGGETVIVDATFLQAARRRQLRHAAEDAGVPWAMVHADAPPEVLVDRVRRRSAAGSDASEAGEEVLAQQRHRLQPLDPAEGGRCITVDTSRPVDAAALAAALRDILASHAPRAAPDASGEQLHAGNQQ